MLERAWLVAQTSFPLDLRRAGTDDDAVQIRDLPEYPLREIGVPTLLVHGTADRNVAYAPSETAARQSRAPAW